MQHVFSMEVLGVLDDKKLKHMSHKISIKQKLKSKSKSRHALIVLNLTVLALYTY